MLTPHAGELGRLPGTDSGWVGAHRLQAARQAAERFGAVLLLKGQDTIVAAPGEGAIACDLGPAFARDRGNRRRPDRRRRRLPRQGVEQQLAAAAAAVAHARAAELAPNRAGLVASDLLNYLPRALES